MSPDEIALLNTVATRVDHAIREGHEEGLAGLRESERQLVSAMDFVAPELHTLVDYRAAIDTLEDLRRAIEAELILEGVPDDDIKLVIVF